MTLDLGDPHTILVPSDDSLTRAMRRCIVAEDDRSQGADCQRHQRHIRRASCLATFLPDRLARPCCMDLVFVSLDTSPATQKVAILRYFAGQTLEPDGETYPTQSPETLLFAHRETRGVIVAITPENFPIAIPAWKMAPALAYGNTVVWKPAEIVPLTTIHLVRSLVKRRTSGRGLEPPPRERFRSRTPLVSSPPGRTRSRSLGPTR